MSEYTNIDSKFTSVGRLINYIRSHPNDDIIEYLESNKCPKLCIHLEERTAYTEMDELTHEIPMEVYALAMLNTIYYNNFKNKYITYDQLMKYRDIVMKDMIFRGVIFTSPVSDEDFKSHIVTSSMFNAYSDVDAVYIDLSDSAIGKLESDRDYLINTIESIINRNSEMMAAFYSSRAVTFVMKINDNYDFKVRPRWTIGSFRNKENFTCSNCGQKTEYAEEICPLCRCKMDRR